MRPRPSAVALPWPALAAVALLVALGGAAGAAAGGRSTAVPCLPLQSDPSYEQGLLQTLAQKQDAWGDELLRAPGGPTYEAARQKLHPLFLVGRPAGLRPKRLTDSGVYYLPFGQPSGWGGAGRVQLHVADGSQVVSQVADGARLTLWLGAERYGSCLSRLATPSLAEGYQPVLETSYTDANGVRYQQESFAARIPQTQALVSFVHLSVDPTGARVPSVTVRFTPSLRLHRVGRQLRLHRGRAWALIGPGAGVHHGSIVFTVRQPRDLYVAWLNRAARVRGFTLDETSYEQARSAVEAYWDAKLAAGAQLVVPEERVYDAERSLLIQNLELSWRYSAGNPYERFSWELPDVAEVMGAYGYPGVEQSILDASLHAPTVFPNRSAGERMVASADYFRRFGDTAYVTRVTPRFRRDVASFVRQLDGGTRSLLRRERYGADILGPIYGLHGQALALQGLRAMADVWARTGYPNLAAEASLAADRLDAGLQAAVAAAQVQLPDGSVFVPIALVDGQEHPYDSVTSSKRGSYWNLVMPYVLASGFVRPHTPLADGLLAYLLNHGSRLLGLVRFSPHTGVINPGYQKPGTDDVYGTNVSRFLADEDQPDQLVLSLYGKLAAGMTENTFVAGEGSTVLPTPGQYYRWMFRPPNSANNAFFLETLRLLLVHETSDAVGVPRGLELAYSTPRAWLAPGKEIAVQNLQTSFGKLSYTIDAATTTVHAAIDLPPGFTGPLRLRLRLPPGKRLGTVTVDGAAFHSLVDAETLDLAGHSGHVDVLARVL